MASHPPSAAVARDYPCPVCRLPLPTLGKMKSHMVRRHPRAPRNYRPQAAGADGRPSSGWKPRTASGGTDHGLASLCSPTCGIAAASTAVGSEVAPAAQPVTPENPRMTPVTSAKPPRPPRRASRLQRRRVMGLADATAVVDPQLRLLFQASAETVSREDVGRPNPPPVPSSGKRRRAAARRSTPWTRFGAVCTTARASFERLGDWIRSEPAASLRPGARPFLFAGRRLRALREFVAESGGSGLSTADQTRLYKLLVMGSWQRRGCRSGPHDVGTAV